MNPGNNKAGNLEAARDSPYQGIKLFMKDMGRDTL